MDPGTLNDQGGIKGALAHGRAKEVKRNGEG